MDPYLKYVGGKRRLVPALTAVLDERIGSRRMRTYCEPFAGSAALFFGLHERIDRAMLGDTLSRIIDTHGSVASHPLAVAGALQALPTLTWQSDYYRVRDDFNAVGRWDHIQAARMIWLNYTGYNGLYRENQSGGYNVPVGKYVRLPAWPSRERLVEASEALSCVTFAHGDFASTLGSDDGTGWDVIYLDPPYVPAAEELPEGDGDSAGFNSYGGSSFDYAQTFAMLQAGGNWVREGAVVLATNHVTPWTLEHYAEHGFELMQTVRVRRSVSAGARWEAREGIWIAGGSL